THVPVIVAHLRPFSHLSSWVAVCLTRELRLLPSTAEQRVPPPLEVPKRVRRLAVDAYLEMDVGAEAVAGAVAETDDLALCDLLAPAHEESLLGPAARGEAAPMVDARVVPIATLR